MELIYIHRRKCVQVSVDLFLSSVIFCLWPFTSLNKGFCASLTEHVKYWIRKWLLEALYRYGRNGKKIVNVIVD